MAEETFYSALHWAKKAEASAKLAAENAQSGGKLLQLGFDGSMENSQLVFKHAPGGVEVPYQLVDDVEYELDLAYSELSELPSATQMIVKNGNDTLTFVSAEHRSSTEPARVADMDAVMRYDATTGYRWLFKATFKIAPNGAKVFLLYPVVAAKDYSDKTNCITEIPQDIKLETDSNGKTWLKAGSKCYKPNGTVINIVNDIAVGRTTTAQEFIGVSADGSRITLNVRPSRCYSGTTAPTGFSGYGLWLDTNSMTYKYSTDGGSTWTVGDYSLPIALVTMKNVAGEVTSIDKVFNGFGYIGSTVFALPGVRGLIPNGRNADGSLRNDEYTFNKLTTYTANSTANFKMYIDKLGAVFFTTQVSYDKDKNLNIITSSGVDRYCCEVGSLSMQAGVISNFSPKLPFRAADMNDVAKLDGDNVFSGKNKFQNNIGLNANLYKILPNYNIADTVTSTTWFGGLYFNEGTDTEAAALMQIGKLSGGDNFLNINIKKPDGTWTDGLDIHAKNSGSYVSIPTPLSTATGKEAVNAAWVRNKAVTYTNYSNSVAITLPTSTSNQYTCPSNGLLWGMLAFGDTVGYIYINGKQFPAGRGLNSWNNSHMITLYLNKGDVIYFEHTWAAPNSQLYFLPTA